MDSFTIRQKYLQFFVDKGHKVIPSAPLVPENDPTTLFNSSGMQPLVPYLLGQPHPQGKRLVNSQKSFRAQDIDEVGDNRHTTFFEMLGNWSLGDYFKQEQLSWIFEFLTQELKLDPAKLYVTVFEGNQSVPKDTESISIWEKLFQQVGIDAKVGERIFTYPAKKNWWSRSGEPEKMPSGEPGGPDSEVFYEFTSVPHDQKFGKSCHPNCDCGRFLEIANSVFMQYQKQPDGSLKELSQKNVDFGGGLERLVATTNDDPDMFHSDFFSQAITQLETMSTSKKYTANPKPFRIIADHVRASVFMIADGVTPSNKEQGYVLRRLLRRAMIYGRGLGILQQDWTTPLVAAVSAPYGSIYKEVTDHQSRITQVIAEEVKKFTSTLEKGLKEFEKHAAIHKDFTAEETFFLYETYGFPYELSLEEAQKLKVTIPSKEDFDIQAKKHQEKSRSTSAGMFKGGLADHSEQVVKLHTATHLLHQALRQVLGDHIHQQGSNITAERLRFDFTHPQTLTPEEIKQVEKIINQKISDNLPVHHTMEPKEDALKSGAMAFFRDKYADTVSVYTIGNNPKTDWFSRELCGGPHVASTGVIGPVKIKKAESIGGGIRRVYAVLENP